MIDDPLQQLEADAAVQGIPFGEVLRAAEVAPSTYWRWRRDKFEPRAASIRKLRQGLDAISERRKATPSLTPTQDAAA